jgi:tetratricopeptide (TPR) repeat protein
MMGSYYRRRATKEGLEKGIEFFEQAIKKDPNYAPAYAGLAFTYGALGLIGVLPPKEARQKQELAVLKALQIDNDLAEAHAAMAYVSPYDFALIYMGLGDKNQAFTWLEKTYEERPDTLNYIKTDPIFDNLRSDPRFTDLLRRMKLAA